MTRATASFLLLLAADGGARVVALSSAGLACTLAAGFLGWMLVQDYHIGIRLTPTQERDETTVQNARPIGVRHDRAA